MIRLKILLALTSLIMVSCQITEQSKKGECLKWKTAVIEKKERLPYPMQGTIIREEQFTTCVGRAEIKHA